MIKLTAKQTQQIKEHTLSCYPEEMCGIIVGENFIPLKNVADNPKKEFRILEQDLIPYLGKIIAIVHSHCYNSERPGILDIRTPSATDIKQQKLSNVPWLILGTDGSVTTPYIQIPREPSKELLGRPFMWFVNDCYTLVQDYYKFNLNIDLPEHKADVDYKQLKNHDNLFDEYIEEYGFEASDDITNLKNGDLLLLNNGLAYRNHLGIYHNEHVLHQEELSLSQPFATFIGRINKVLRYVG